MGWRARQGGSSRSSPSAARGEGRGDGDEDRACAEYLSAGLHGRRADAGPFLARVRASVPGRLFADAAHPEYPAEDLHCCLALDRFDFALRVERQDTGLSMRAVRSALGPTND